MGNSKSSQTCLTDFVSDTSYIENFENFENLIKSSKTNYIFSPDTWTVLQPNLATKNWNELNLDSNLNMFIQFDINISTIYPVWRNIFHFTDGGSEIRLPAMWVSPNGTSFSVCNSSNTESWAYIETPSIPLNTNTNVVITIYQGSVNIYFNAVFQNTQTIAGILMEANENTILYISDPWYQTDGGVKIKNLTFGNLSESIKCSKDKICVGFEPDNRAYCYGSNAACMWGGNQCSTNTDCRTNYNITSPKYNGGGSDYCQSPLNTLSTSWPTGACPDIYLRNINETCTYQMSNTELQCYQNNNPDLKGLNPTQLQENWTKSGCIEGRNNQCPSYQNTSGLYNYIGCYNDMCYNGSDGPRALPNYRGIVQSIDQCQEIATQYKESLFGVEDGGQCYTGSNLQSAQQYGLNVDGIKCAALGSSCTLQVYQRSTPYPPPNPPRPVLTPADFANNIEKFSNFEEKKRDKKNIIFIFLIIFLIFLFYYFFCF